MKTGHWFIIMIFAWIVGFAGGYTLSAKTGTEPGYFGAVEAAGYGGDDAKLQGVSEEMGQYYKGLTEE